MIRFWVGQSKTFMGQLLNKPSCCLHYLLRVVILFEASLMSSSTFPQPWPPWLSLRKPLVWHWVVSSCHNTYSSLLNKTRENSFFMHLISEVSQWLLFFWTLLRENLTLTQSDIDTKTFYWSHKRSRWILEHNKPEQIVKAGKLVIRWFLVTLSLWQFILGLVSLFMWQDQITVLVLPNFSVLIKAQYQIFF